MTETGEINPVADTKNKRNHRLAQIMTRSLFLLDFGSKDGTIECDSVELQPEASMSVLRKLVLSQQGCSNWWSLFAVKSLRDRNCFKAFFRSESGSYTIESLIWLPIYMFIVALILNVSMVYSMQSQFLRIVQDGNRSYSVGRINNREAVEQYVIDRVAHFGANPTVSSDLVGDIIHTELRIPATDLMPFALLHKFFATTTVVVSAQQIVEF